MYSARLEWAKAYIKYSQFPCCHVRGWEHSPPHSTRRTHTRVTLHANLRTPVVCVCVRVWLVVAPRLPPHPLITICPEATAFSNFLVNWCTANESQHPISQTEIRRKQRQGEGEGGGGRARGEREKGERKKDTETERARENHTDSFCMDEGYHS